MGLLPSLGIGDATCDGQSFSARNSVVMASTHVCGSRTMSGILVPKTISLNERANLTWHIIRNR